MRGIPTKSNPKSRQPELQLKMDTVSELMWTFLPYSESTDVSIGILGSVFDCPLLADQVHESTKAAVELKESALLMGTMDEAFEMLLLKLPNLSKPLSCLRK